MKWQTSAKYLRLQIDNKLNFSNHINHSVNKTKAAKNILYPLINDQSSFLNPQNYIYL